MASEHRLLKFSLPLRLMTTAPADQANGLSGFAEWLFLRVEQWLASTPKAAAITFCDGLAVGPGSHGDQIADEWRVDVLTHGLIRQRRSNLDIQGTVGVAVPMSHTDTQGHQIQTNYAIQYHVLDVLWPQVEVNWTDYPDGHRGGLNQVFLTIGLALCRLSLGDHMRFAFGGGYQIATAPSSYAKPLTPAVDHGWLFT